MTQAAQATMVSQQNCTTAPRVSGSRYGASSISGSNWNPSSTAALLVPVTSMPRSLLPRLRPVAVRLFDSAATCVCLTCNHSYRTSQKACLRSVSLAHIRGGKQPAGVMLSAWRNHGSKGDNLDSKLHRQLPSLEIGRPGAHVDALLCVGKLLMILLFHPLRD